MNGFLRHTFFFVLALALAGANIQATSVGLGAAQETGTIRITIRGCPDGPINPFTNSLDTCTIPLDAPDAAVASWGEGPGNRVEIATDAERAFDGTYVIDNIPANSSVWLRGFEPVAHNAFEIIGGDDTIPPDPWTAQIQLGPGANRDLVAFYWNGEGGFSEQGEGTLELRLRGCPDGLDPTILVDPSGVCDVPLDAPEDAYAMWEMESGALVATAPRLNDGTYVIEGIPPFQHVGLIGFEPTLRDAFVVTGIDYTAPDGMPIVLLERGETAHLDVYYYNSGETASSPESGSLDITLRGCPEGVDPTISGDPWAECTVPLDAPGDAGVVWGGDGQGGIPLADAPRLFDGTYHFETVPTDRTLTFPGFEPTERDLFAMFGIDGVNPGGVPFLDVAPGEAAHIYVFYYYVD